MKSKPYIKSIYKLPSEKLFYTVIIKDLQYKNDNKYIIKQVKDLRNFMHKHNKQKYIIILYFKNIDSYLDLSILKKYNRSSDLYEINDLNSITKTIESNYVINYEKPKINFDKNENVICKICKIITDTNDELLNHLETCKTFQYTLFGEPIPKELKVKNKIKIIDLSKCKKIHQEKFSFCLNEIKLIQYKNHLPVFIDNNNLSFDTNYFLTSDEDYIFTPNILYVAKSEAWDNDIFKIGIVNSICILKKRFQVYNTGRLKGKDFMLCVCIFPVLKPFELEKQLRHFLLKDYHLSNELYAIPIDLLISKLRPLSVPLID